MTITNRYIDLTSSKDYGFVTNKPTNAATEKKVSFYDERSGETLTVRLPLVSLDFKGKHDSGDRTDIESIVLDSAITDKGAASFGWEWRDDLKIPLKATLTGEYLKFGKLYIPYDAKAPVYLTFEESVLNSLGLDLEKYRITGSYWSGDVKVEDGVEVRYGYFTGERYCADFVAVYEGRLTLPDVRGYKVPLVYEAFSEKDNAPAILGVGGAILLAIPLLTWFFIAHRKKKKENGNNDKAQKIILLLLVMIMLLGAAAPMAFASSGDVAGAIEGTWSDARGQIKQVVNNVVFPVIDLILAVFFFVKIGMTYF